MKRSARLAMLALGAALVIAAAGADLYPHTRPRLHLPVFAFNPAIAHLEVTLR